jgi:LEA14-like dessication related protein
VSIDVTPKKIGLLVAGLLVVVATAGVGVALSYDAPEVRETTSAFDNVSEDEADVQTRIVLNNPNTRAYPGQFDLGVIVTLNGIEVANGAKRGVRIEPGRNELQTTARFDNTKIPAWWVTHINNGEQTAMETRARVRPYGLPLGPTITAQNRTITTDLLGPLGDEGRSTVRLGDSDVLVVGNQRAQWREADEETTPLEFSNDLENVHNRTVSLDGTDYVVQMNGVIVGQGETNDGITLEPGESSTLTVNAALDTPKMQEWWVTHLRNGESTDLTIEVFAVIDDGEERKRLPLTVFERRATFETDLLGTGETSVTVVEGEATPEFTQPRVEGTQSEWGEVRDEETEVRTTIDIVNDNDEAFTNLLTLSIDQRTTLAGVTVTNGSEQVSDLPQGSGQVEVVSTMPHDTVPEWWAAHLRNGENSTSRTELSGEADIGVTTLPLELQNRESRIETALLADLNDDSARDVRSDETGQRLLTVHSTTAEWRNVSAEEATIHVEADLENENQLASVTIKELDYIIDINNVTLADDRAPQSHTLDPGERRTVTFTLVLDNSKMAEWWPTHIRRGESSELDRQVTATVDTDGDEERVDLEFLSDTVAIETDLLAE